jgi:hypothetical protein
MSKIRVDRIENSSGVGVTFPSAALPDGYLKVSSSGVLSTIDALPSKSEVITIYDADVDGVISGTNVSKTLTSEQVSKIVNGNRCTMFFSNVSYMNTGWRFIGGNDASPTNLADCNFVFKGHSPAGGVFQGNDNGQSYIPNCRDVWQNGNITNMIGGMGFCDFQITNISGSQAVITFKVVNQAHYRNERRDDYDKIAVYYGHGNFDHATYPLFRLDFNEVTVNQGGGISLLIQGDK